jgi:uncharacterized OB-fold protein
MPGYLPVPDQIDAPYWYAGRDGVLRLQRCVCGHLNFPPGRRCHACGSKELTWEDMSGEAEIWSWVVMRKQYFADMKPPYTVIRVKLAEGPYIITNLVGAGDRAPKIGDKVRVTFEQAGDIYLPQFAFAD